MGRIFRRYWLTMAIAAAAIAPLIGGCLAGHEDASPTKLSPRCRDVLHCLLKGLSDKEIAVALRLSVNTVNHYMKQIHRAYNLQSCRELLARWVRRAGLRCSWKNQRRQDDRFPVTSHHVLPEFWRE